MMMIGWTMAMVTCAHLYPALRQQDCMSNRGVVHMLQSELAPLPAD